MFMKFTCLNFSTYIWINQGKPFLDTKFNTVKKLKQKTYIDEFQNDYLE